MNSASTAVADRGVGDNLLECLQRIRQHEIEEARRLQLAMIPVDPLRTHAAELVGKIRPVSEVGGDFLDYFQIPDGRIGFYVGDVVGKGLPAALYAALTIGTLRGFNKHMETPCSLLAHLNQRLRVHSLAGRYCAVQYGLFDPATRCRYRSTSRRQVRSRSARADCLPAFWSVLRMRSTPSDLRRANQ